MVLHETLLPLSNCCTCFFGLSAFSIKAWQRVCLKNIAKSKLESQYQTNKQNPLHEWKTTVCFTGFSSTFRKAKTKKKICIRGDSYGTTGSMLRVDEGEYIEQSDHSLTLIGTSLPLFYPHGSNLLIIVKQLFNVMLKIIDKQERNQIHESVDGQKGHSFLEGFCSQASTAFPVTAAQGHVENCRWGEAGLDALGSSSTKCGRWLQELVLSQRFCHMHDG